MTPDFAALFPRPADEDDWNLEPRVAFALWHSLHPIIDQLHFDVRSFESYRRQGQDPFQGGIRLSSLPRIAWGQDRKFAQEILRAATDLLGELESGQIPFPRNVAEEIILYRAIQDADGWIIDEAEDDEDFGKLPPTEEEFSVNAQLQDLYQDTDFLFLFQDDLDGVEDPSITGPLGMVDLRSNEWFTWFGNAEPRDPSRPYWQYYGDPIVSDAAQRLADLIEEAVQEARDKKFEAGHSSPEDPEITMQLAAVRARTRRDALLEAWLAVVGKTHNSVTPE